MAIERLSRDPTWSVPLAPPPRHARADRLSSPTARLDAPVLLATANVLRVRGGLRPTPGPRCARWNARARSTPRRAHSLSSAPAPRRRSRRDENLGGLFRNAAAFGVDGVCDSDDRRSPVSSLVRPSTGRCPRRAFARSASLPESLAMVRTAGVTALALTPRRPRRSISAWATSSPGPLADLAVVRPKARVCPQPCLAAADLACRITDGTRRRFAERRDRRGGCASICGRIETGSSTARIGPVDRDEPFCRHALTPTRIPCISRSSAPAYPPGLCPSSPGPPSGHHFRGR